MGKDMWDAPKPRFSVSDVGSELYAMEQYYDYKMMMSGPSFSMLIRYSPLIRNMRNLHVCYRASLFAGGIIAKLLFSWKFFTTTK
jgi:hypothetical protein